MQFQFSDCLNGKRSKDHIWLTKPERIQVKAITSSPALEAAWVQEVRIMVGCYGCCVNHRSGKETGNVMVDALCFVFLCFFRCTPFKWHCLQKGIMGPFDLKRRKTMIGACGHNGFGVNHGSGKRCDTCCVLLWCSRLVAPSYVATLLPYSILDKLM